MMTDIKINKTIYHKKLNSGEIVRISKAEYEKLKEEYASKHPLK